MVLNNLVTASCKNVKEHTGITFVVESGISPVFNREEYQTFGMLPELSTTKCRSQEVGWVGTE